MVHLIVQLSKYIMIILFLIYTFLIRSFCFSNCVISLSISSVLVGLWSARIGKKYFLTDISYSTKS